jgi:hypothetical protein
MLHNLICYSMLISVTEAKEAEDKIVSVFHSFRHSDDLAWHFVLARNQTFPSQAPLRYSETSFASRIRVQELRVTTLVFR